MTLTAAIAQERAERQQWRNFLGSLKTRGLDSGRPCMHSYNDNLLTLDHCFL